MTVLDLIKRSMRLIGAINIGDQPTADEQMDCFAALNAMVDAWGTEPLTKFTSSRTIYPINPGQQVYWIGPNGADWLTATGQPRPARIDAAGLLLSNADPTQTIERPLRILLTDQEWAHVRVKGIPSTIPTELYYQPDYPNGQVALWPAPSGAAQIALYVKADIPQAVTLTSVVTLPAGYARALVYNLALEIAPEFDLTPSELVFATASDAKTNLKRMNLRLNKLRTERTLGTSGGHWDYLIGETR